MGTPRFPLRVLMVAEADDERARLRMMLQKVGITSTQSASATGALDGAIAMKPDLIVIDSADDNAALAVIKHIRRSSDQRVARTPALLLTSSTDRSYIEKARDLGLDAMLLKPVISTMLRQRIDAITSDMRRFVRNRSYIGPCRREDSEYSGPQRRGSRHART